MYIYLLGIAYEGEHVITTCVNDAQAIAYWQNWCEHVPESARLRRVHNTGTEIVKEEYQYWDGTWVEINWAGRRIGE